MLRIYQNGHFYFVNEKNQIHGGPNNVKPDNNWLLVGAVELRSVFGNLVTIRKYTTDEIRQGQVPWRFKNGSQRCFIVDQDYGTLRTWMSPTPYWTEGQTSTIKSLPKERAINLVESVCEALWPKGNCDHEWSADTLDEIAQILQDFYPGPK